ncbi:MAG TPA: sigma-70 family RNA polymerase sigma factor [Gemmataceae bacterium]|nr:sigma-70 family RNA polymerase sigma factor [Gemmataceae bacterium]
MDEQAEFASLMRRVSEGSEDAVKELLERYGPSILRVVRRRLSRRMRSKFDSADFTQSVWASFFAVPRGGLDFKTAEAFVAYLVNMTRNKMVDALRRRQALKKYNVNREHSLEGSAALEARGIAGAQPTPSQILVARERFQQLAQGLPAHQRIVLEFLRQGSTHQEIADALGINEKSIRRLVEKIAPELLPDDVAGSATTS